MEERVVNVPLAGGINQDDDVFSVQPPEMQSLLNVQSIVKGAFDSRLGMELVTQTANKLPALSFSTPTGGTSPVSPAVEAISANSSASGTRAVLASGGKFFDWVGGQDERGWREVNDLPEHVGTLVSTSSTGGSIIEIESLTYDNETKRVTFWVTGKRTGQELSSDRMMLDQENGDGNSVYYSVQVVGTDAYIVPPTRVLNPLGSKVTSAKNLRLVALPVTGSLASTVWPMAFWWNAATGNVEHVLVSPDTGAIVGTTAKVLTSPTAILMVDTHRNFDVCSIAPTVGGVPSQALVWAMCEKDSASNVTPARIEATAGVVNTVTGVVSVLATVPDILFRGPRITEGFLPWANRGIMLYQRTSALPAGPSDWMANVGYAARVVARYYASGEGGIAGTDRLDGQLVAGMIRPSVAGSVWSLAYVGGKYIPLIGFQTTDDLSAVLATAQAPRRQTGGPNTERVVKSGLAWPAPGGVPVAGPFQANGTTPTPNSEWTIAIELDDGSDQVYFCDIGVSRDDLYTLTPRSSSPYQTVGAADFDGSDAQFTAVRSAYVLTERRYQSDLPIRWVQVPEPGRQVQLVTLPAPGSAGNTGYTPGTYTNCSILVGGAVVATCTVRVGRTTTGIEAIAIQNPLGGPVPGGFAFVGANVAQAVDANGITGITGAGTLTGAQIYNLTSGMIQQPVGSDIPNLATRGADTSFYYIGQQEHCVHRWAVSTDDEKNFNIALSSASASPTTNPQGDAPFGAASPHKLNNFLEIYAYTETFVSEYEPLVPYSGGTSTALRCALGGPWRIVSDIYRAGSVNYVAATPAGDDSQASTFLLRFDESQEATISLPGGRPNLELAPYPSASSVAYVNNVGFFVEGANMMRVTAPPLNVPSLRLTQNGFTVGALRNGSSKGLQECFAIDYEYLAQNWRQMVRMSDYTFINGGLLSVFDGVNCNEHGMLVWPQRDLTSISWGDGGAQPQYLASAPNIQNPFQRFQSSSALLQFFYLLNNVSKPFFFYEVGLNGSTNFGNLTTQWGGDPSSNYEAIYADGRIQQFSSFTKPGYEGGASAFGPHYYGRYQNAGSGFSNDNNNPSIVGTESYFLWAPRSAAGWSDPATGTVKGNRESAYSQSEVGGDFLMSWCYEYADGTGRIVRSSPSSPIQYTVCAEIYSSYPVPRDRGAIRRGGRVTVFKWGVFVPRLELTNRLNAASEDPRRVTLQPYSTCEPYSTVMYRMPWQNFLNPINDFVVPRNATRGVVPYASRPFDALSIGAGTITTTPCGLVFTNHNRVPSPPDYKDGYNGMFDGPTGDYNGMLREPYLYTTGGVLDNVAPPGCKAMCVHQNRLVIGGADDATVVWFTKELSPTDAPGFNDTLTLTIESGGAVTGLASMNSNLFIFKENDIYVVAGTMPDATGQSSSLSEPTRLPSGIGCTDPRSVLTTPIGIFFRSPRSIELLTPDLQIRPIGDKVKQRLETYPFVTSVSHNPATEEVYFVCQTNRVSRVVTGSAFTVLVYSYMSNSWYEWSLAALGEGPASMTVIDNKPWLACANPVDDPTIQAHVYQQGNGYVDGLANAGATYTYQYIPVLWQTAPFALNEVQGFQRTKRIRLLARAFTATGIPGMSMLLGTDGSASQTVTFTSGEVTSINSIQGLIQLEAHVANQKGQLIVMGAQTLSPPSISQNTTGVRFSNIALVVGLKSGLNKRITEEAKH
jgi:hypothetical protein